MTDFNISWKLPSNFIPGTTASLGQVKKTASPETKNSVSVNAETLYTEMTSVGVNDLTPSMSFNDSEISSALSKTGTTSGLVSIYALLSLLLETANEQKKVASMTKQADIAVQQASIQAQADAQRSAGLFNAILGTCTSVIAGGFSVGGAVQGLKGLNTQSNIAKNYNIPGLSNEVKTNFTAMEAQQSKVTGLENQLKTAQSGSGNQNNDTKVLNDQLKTEKAKLDDCVKNYENSQNKLNVQEKAMMNDPEYLKAAYSIKQSDLFAALAPTMNGLGQSIVNGFSTILNAEATAMGSITKGYEGNEERDKAMIDDAAKLQQQVLQTFAQIVQTESQTARDIIHA